MVKKRTTTSINVGLDTLFNFLKLFKAREEYRNLKGEDLDIRDLISEEGFFQSDNLRSLFKGLNELIEYIKEFEDSLKKGLEDSLGYLSSMDSPSTLLSYFKTLISQHKKKFNQISQVLEHLTRLLQQKEGYADFEESNGFDALQELYSIDKKSNALDFLTDDKIDEIKTNLKKVYSLLNPLKSLGSDLDLNAFATLGDSIIKIQKRNDERRLKKFIDNFENRALSVYNILLKNYDNFCRLNALMQLLMNEKTKPKKESPKSLVFLLTSATKGKVYTLRERLKIGRVDFLLLNTKLKYKATAISRNLIELQKIDRKVFATIIGQSSTYIIDEKAFENMLNTIYNENEFRKIVISNQKNHSKTFSMTLDKWYIGYNWLEDGTHRAIFAFAVVENNDHKITMAKSRFDKHINHLYKP